MSGPQPASEYVIETPENVSFGYSVADIGSRFLATLIDSLIQGTLYALLLVAYLLVAVGAGLTGALSSGLSRASNGIENWIGVLFILVLFLIQFGYFMVLEIVTHGQSPGKSLLGLRVVKENGFPLSPVDSIIRNLVRVIDFFPVGYGVGVIVMFLNSKAKRLGDLAAGTLVVKVGEPIKLSDLPSPSSGATEVPGLHRLGEAEIELAEAYLARRKQLHNGSALGAEIAQTLRQRADSSELDAYAATLSTDEFIQKVVAAFRAPRARKEEEMKNEARQ